MRAPEYSLDLPFVVLEYFQSAPMITLHSPKGIKAAEPGFVVVVVCRKKAPSLETINRAQKIKIDPSKSPVLS